MNADILTADHASALKAIAAGVILGPDRSTVEKVAFVLGCRLSPAERAGLLHAALLAADPDDVRAQINEILPEYLAGPPLPAFLDIEADASWWADFATAPELRSYLLAIYARLPATDKAAFLEAVKGKTAA